jgi:ferredoxin
MIFKKKKKDSSVDTNKRRTLLVGLTAAITIPVAITQLKYKEILDDDIPAINTRQIPLTPPGSNSAEHFNTHCSSCHLCITRCPSKVLKPAFLEYGITGIMQPTMHFEKGYCNYNCIDCSAICPTGALQELNVEQKHLLQIGRVVFRSELCVVHTQGTNCGACSEHCPTQAVTMLEGKDGLTIPFIDVELCVGCGGCEYICPVRPYTAIYVEGNKIHKKAKPVEIEKSEENKIIDFGF